MEKFRSIHREEKALKLKAEKEKQRTA